MCRALPFQRFSTSTAQRRRPPLCFSLRLENIRDGLEDYEYLDYEYLHLLAEKVERVSKLPATTPRQAFLDQARPLLAVPDAVVRSVVEYTLEPNAVQDWRTLLATLIIQADGLSSN